MGHRLATYTDIIGERQAFNPLVKNRSVGGPIIQTTEPSTILSTVNGTEYFIKLLQMRFSPVQWRAGSVRVCESKCGIPLPACTCETMATMT